MIFVIDDDEIMGECVAKACGPGAEVQIFSNAIEAISKINIRDIPKLIFLDILLDGPDGFTFLNEIMSYSDTGKIPIVIVTSLNLDKMDLSEYGVVGILNKETLRPEDILDYVKEYAS